MSAIRKHPSRVQLLNRNGRSGMLWLPYFKRVFPTVASI
jgi:hypothetical protein